MLREGASGGEEQGGGCTEEKGEGGKRVFDKEGVKNGSGTAIEEEREDERSMFGGKGGGS